MFKQKNRRKAKAFRPKNVFKNYSASGAPTGHSAAQEPQSMHLSASITYLPSPSEIASTGQASAQAPHMMQASEILYAIIKKPPL
jgi:hypothetical protein